MITPSYSATATERVLPRLALDFTTSALDPRVAVTRALNTATRVNSSGLIETVNADLPRFDYDPVTLQPKGLLIEDQRTNALAYSEELGNAVWTKSNSSIVDNSTTSPSGLTNADTLVENTATSTHFIQSTASVVGTPVVCSFYAKKKERSKVGFGGAGFNAQGFQAVWDLDSGTVFTNIGGRASIQALANGWYRCSVAFTPSNTSGSIILLCDDTGSNSYTGDGTSGLFLWGVQTEAGAFATSYIPTTTTSLTRNADVVSMTGANFSSWYNSSEGTFAADATTLSPLGSTQRIFSASTGSFADSINASASGTDLFCQCFTAGGLEANMFFAGGASNTTFSLSYAYKANNAAAALKAGSVTTDTSIILPTPNQFGIGNEGGFALFNGWVNNIRYWPQRLTDAEVQAFSK
jgi:hypothetical protein